MGVDELSGADKSERSATRTQYNTQKTAEQEVVWAIDPTGGLTRQRQVWRSTGTLFDSTRFTNGDGEIEINLGATGSHQARVKSAYVCRYVAHTLIEPGIGVSVADANVNIDANNEVSLDHGLIQFGAFYHDGSTGSNAAGVTDGFGIEIDSSGARFFSRANSTHTGNSPVAQPDWNIDKLNRDGESLDVSLQNVFNFAYGFYNALPLTASKIDPGTPVEDRRASQTMMHSEETQSDPLLHFPSLPVQVFVSNEGTATALDAFVGGMQSARYGQRDIDFRTTSDYRITTGGTFTSSEGGEPDPSNESGDAFFAYRRKSGEKDLVMKDKQVTIDPTANVYIYFWDEWDPGTALNGTFGEAQGVSTAGGTATDTNEALIETQTDCTTYTPTIANFRGARRASSGQNNEIDPQNENVDDRVPQEATRVWTLAIRDGSQDVDLNYLEAEVQEAH